MHWPKFRRSALYTSALIFLLAFPYGPLFPWSPWKPGYEHLALQRSDIYWPKGATLPDAYRQFDDLIAETERFEQLECSKRITVVQCNTWIQFRRLMPHMAGHGLAAVTLATGSEIYVTPKLNEKKFDHREFLLHELGHALINQHQSIAQAFEFTKIDWLSEGIAVANGQQQSFLSRSEVQQRAVTVALGPIIDPARRGELSAGLDLRFGYPVWRYFNEFLIARHGRDCYQRFLLATAQNPLDWRNEFQQTFGVPFRQDINEFQETFQPLR